MHGKRSTAIALMTFTALCSVSAAAPAGKAPKNPLEACVAAEAKKSNISGVISIMRPGGAVSYAQGFMAGPGSAPMRADAQFNLGSASKMWTAVAVAQLVDARKITLDDPIGRYVSGLTKEASAVTIRQLLTHSGGLGNFFTPDNLAAMQSARSLADLKPLVVADKPAFTPGERSQYSNSGFLLLGLMIEKVSGKSYGDYLKAHIFAPAGMTGSGLEPAGPAIRAIGMTNFPAPDALGQGGPHPGPGAAPAGGPNGHMLPPPGPLRPADEAALMGSSAGGSFSTAADMQRFFAALFDGRLTSVAMRDALTSRQIEILPARDRLPAVYYGLGFGA